jgi:hypothetical protein
MLVMDTVVGMATLLLWPGVSTQDLAAGNSTLHSDPAFLAFALFSGSLSTAIGGGICARLAKALPYWNVLVFGVVNLAIGVWMSSPDSALWFSIVGYVSTVPVGFVGARFALQRA